MEAASSGAERRLVGVSEAARILNVNKSQISRQVGKLFPNHAPPGAAPLIDVDEARAARARQLNPLKARHRGGPMGYERNLLEQGAAPPGDDDEPPPERGQSSALAQAHAEDKALSARLKRVALARELGEVRGVAEVETEQETAGRIARDRLMGLAVDVAGAVVGMCARGAGEFEVRQFLQTKLRACLENLSDELDDFADESERAAAADGAAAG